jgi:hypothetical protein
MMIVGLVMIMTPIPPLIETRFLGQYPLNLISVIIMAMLIREINEGKTEFLLECLNSAAN